jgi:hypothetical protein
VIALAYAACFLALAALAGLAAASGGRWLLRAPLVAATPLLALGVWWQLSQRDGWPTGAHPAEGSAFVAGLVHSPAPGDPGAIYLWTQPPGTATPRAYRLPYSPALEQQVAHAAKEAKRGVRIAVSSRRARGPAGQKGPRSAVRFIRLPPADLGVKRHEGAAALSPSGG